jgi:hypothetical protein
MDNIVFVVIIVQTVYIDILETKTLISYLVKFKFSFKRLNDAYEVAKEIIN